MYHFDTEASSEAFSIRQDLRSIENIRYLRFYHARHVSHAVETRRNHASQESLWLTTPVLGLEATKLLSSSVIMAANTLLIGLLYYVISF